MPIQMVIYASLVLLSSSYSFGDCGSLFATLALEKKNLSTYLDENTLKENFKKIEISFKELPEQTLLALKRFSEDEAWPAQKRVFALETLYRLASSQKTLPLWLREEVISLANQHTGDYLRIQTLRKQEVLPSEYKSEAAPTEKFKVGDQVVTKKQYNSQDGKLNVISMKALAELAPEVFIEKLGKLALLYRDIRNGDSEADQGTLNEIRQEIVVLVGTIKDTINPDLYQKSMETLTSTSVPLAFALARRYDEVKIEEVSPQLDQAIELLEKHVPNYLRETLANASEKSLEYLNQPIVSIACFRSHKSEPTGSKKLANRIEKTLKDSNGRAFDRNELFSLSADAFEIGRRVNIINPFVSAVPAREYDRRATVEAAQWINESFGLMKEHGLDETKTVPNQEFGSRLRLNYITTLVRSIDALIEGIPKSHKSLSLAKDKAKYIHDALVKAGEKFPPKDEIENLFKYSQELVNHLQSIPEQRNTPAKVKPFPSELVESTRSLLISAFDKAERLRTRSGKEDSNVWPTHTSIIRVLLYDLRSHPSFWKEVRRDPKVEAIVASLADAKDEISAKELIGQPK